MTKCSITYRCLPNINAFKLWRGRTNGLLRVFYMVTVATQHLGHRLERNLDGPNSDHHLASTDPASSVPSSSISPSKLRQKELCPSSSLILPLLLISRGASSICEPEGEDTCEYRPVTWQPSQKAFMLVARQGAGIYFPHPPPAPSPRPLAPPRSLKEIHCPCFLSCLPLPALEKNQHISQKRKGELPVLLFVVQARGAAYCTLQPDSFFYI